LTPTPTLCTKSKRPANRKGLTKLKLNANKKKKTINNFRGGLGALVLDVLAN
jgi:hypothetical protein